MQESFHLFLLSVRVDVFLAEQEPHLTGLFV